MAEGYQCQGSGTLMAVYKRLDRPTSDINKSVAHVEQQMMISRVLEARGYSFSEKSNEWVYMLQERLTK